MIDLLQSIDGTLSIVAITLVLILLFKGTTRTSELRRINDRLASIRYNLERIADAMEKGEDNYD